MDSILLSIKKLLGMDPSYQEAFDIDLIMHINSVFSILTQLGVGPEEGFSITSDEQLWSDSTTNLNLDMVRSYMVAKVRLIFDPPTSSSVMEALKRYIDEFEWRINVEVDPGKYIVPVPLPFIGE